MSDKFFNKYSSFNPIVLEKKGRQQIAKQVLAVLKKELGKLNLKKLTLIDLGSSSGIITNYLSGYFGKVIGIDVDNEAIKIAKKTFRKRNLKFISGDAAKVGFKDRSVDIVICNQVYECVPNPQGLFNEIYRILKPGGICFFGGANKFRIWDVQYRLPFVPFFPKQISSFVVRVLGKSSSYDTEYKSWWELRKLFEKFEIIHYTPRIIKNPRKYKFAKLMKVSGVTKFINIKILEILEPFSPNFIWILRKPSH